MWVHATLLLPSAAGIVLARLFPNFFFPPVAKCALKSTEMLQHCKRMSQRFVSMSLFIATVFWGVFWFLSPVIRVQSVADKIAFALKLESAIVLFYIGVIVNVAFRRGSDEKAVMGQRTGTSIRTEIAIRVLNNTSEQLLLAFPSHLSLVVLLPDDKLAVLVAVVSLWLTGRTLFVVGYDESHPMGREFGFQLTLVPTVMVAIFNFVAFVTSS